MADRVADLRANSNPAGSHADSLTKRKLRRHARHGAATPPTWGARMAPPRLCLLALLLPFLAPAVSAQSPDPAPSDTDPYAGFQTHSGYDSVGADSVDLLHQGLNIQQELSPAFSANGLRYQVIANYQGTGTDIRKAGTNLYYAYFSPATVWGPMGAGWSVHMGKVLSSGIIGESGYQCGFGDEDSTSIYNCKCSPMDVTDYVVNTIVDYAGAHHPMWAPPASALPPRYSSDFSWIRADVNPSDFEMYCHVTESWRTPDGTLHDINPDGMVTRMTDLSGNWVRIEYYDEPHEFEFTAKIGLDP